MGGVGTTLFHFLTAVYKAALLYNVRSVAKESRSVYDPAKEIPDYGGLFKYLTHINLWAMLAFFTLQFITDILPRSSFKSKVKAHLSFAFTTILFPMALYVSVSFWAVYAYDENLIYKEVSKLLNHLSHTVIVVWVVAEAVLCRHEFPSLSVAAGPIATFCFLYISWVEWVHAHTGFWVYPVFKALPQNRFYFLLFYGFSIFVCFGLFLIGKAISIIVNAQPTNKQAR